MKRLIAIAMLLILSTSAVQAETVSTCRNIYGTGEVCGETTITEEKVVIVDTAVGDNQMVKLLLSIAGAALVATGLYKLTYKSYLLG